MFVLPIDCLSRVCESTKYDSPDDKIDNLGRHKEEQRVDKIEDTGPHVVKPETFH